MEMLLRSTKHTPSKKTVPSMKAFMDDVTVITKSKSHRWKNAKTPTWAFQEGSNEGKTF